ncbi:MAG: Uma2 family endonuclease [Deinococcota bacterium]
MADVGTPRSKDQSEASTSAPALPDATLDELPMPPTTTSEQLAYMSRFDVTTVAINTAMYHNMASADVLESAKGYELLHSQIIQLEPISPEHNYLAQHLGRQLDRCVNDDAVVFIQGPLAIDEYSEPQPDILLLNPPYEQYDHRHPRPEDVVLVIEVASSTLKTDRTLKLQLYAGANIPEYWIVNLPDKQLETHSTPDPKRGQYLETKRYNVGDEASPKPFPDCQLR